MVQTLHSFCILSFSRQLLFLNLALTSDILIQELILHSLVFKARYLSSEQFHFHACFEFGTNFSWTGANVCFMVEYIKPLVLLLLRERLWFQWCKSEGCHNLQKVATICKSEHCQYFFSFSKVKVATISQKQCTFLSLPLSLSLQGNRSIFFAHYK